MIEGLIIFGLLGLGSWLDRRDIQQAEEWQRLLDITHHGTPLKPYDWKLEEL